MKYTLITDSCCDLFPCDINSDKIDFHVVPLTLIVDNKELVDDENLDVNKFVQMVNQSKTCAKSACPSPETFFEIIKKSDNVILVTLSSKLSGTYASAAVAVDMAKREFPKKNVFLCDSLSAAAGLDFIMYKIKELLETKNDLPWESVCNAVRDICSKTRVRFLLQDLGNLVKNGRLSKMAGKILTTVKVKLICGDDGEGEIKKYGMAMGTKRGLQNLAELPHKDKAPTDSLILISHVFNETDLIFLKNILDKKYGFTNILTAPMRGLSSLYAADKGIVMAY
jgi:DegV family protein with EDD domain